MRREEWKGNACNRSTTNVQTSLAGTRQWAFWGRGGGTKKGEKRENAFFAIFVKNGIAVIFREVTAMANRSGVQVKRAFLYHRRDFLVLNILNTQNRTDSGDTP